MNLSLLFKLKSYFLDSKGRSPKKRMFTFRRWPNQGGRPLPEIFGPLFTDFGCTTWGLDSQKHGVSMELISCCESKLHVLRLKSAIPHPITIQSMRFERKKTNWWKIPLMGKKRCIWIYDRVNESRSFKWYPNLSFKASGVIISVINPNTLFFTFSWNLSCWHITTL